MALKAVLSTYVAEKRSMDLRLLYGVAYGHSWFGRWGYRFCRGSFGVAEHNSISAIELLSSLELEVIIEDFGKTDKTKAEKSSKYFVITET